MVYFVFQILAAVVPKLSSRGATVRWANTDNGSTDIYHKLWHQRNSYNLVSGISMISLFMVSCIDDAGINNLLVTKAMLNKFSCFKVLMLPKFCSFAEFGWMQKSACFIPILEIGAWESIFLKLLCPRTPSFHFGTLLNIVSWPQFSLFILALCSTLFPDPNFPKTVISQGHIFSFWHFAQHCFMTS